MTAEDALRREVLKVAASQIGHGEDHNRNKYTHWYYGGSTAAPWCAIFLSWCFDRADALDAIYGKHAYVPYVERDFRHNDRWGSSPRVGALACLDFNHNGTPEHIGIVEKIRSGGRLQTIEGNTADHVYRRVRSPANVTGYAYPDYSVEKTLKTLVDLGATRPTTAPAGSRHSLSFEKEYMDPEKVHANADSDGRYPSVFPEGKTAPYAVTIEVVLTGRPEPGIQLCVSQYDRDDNTFERDIRGQELVGARTTLTSSIRMSDEHKYRADVVNNSGKDLTIERAYMIITH